MRRAVLAALCMFLMVALSAHASDLQKKIDAMAAAYEGHVALYAKNLTTGESVSVDPTHPVQTASVIKLALMLQAYEQIRDGKLKLSQPVVLTRENQVAGSGVLLELDPGLTLTVKDLIALMITVSDNTATNMLIDVVGLRPTNEMLARMGLANTYFYKKIIVPATDPMPPDQKRFGLGKTTPEEIAKLVESIYRCDLGDRELCVDMITLMRKQQYRAMIPRYLVAPGSSDALSPIADKIGMLDAVRNDVALIYTARGPVILSIFTYDNPDKSWTPENKAEMLIGRLTQTIVSAWSSDGLAAKVNDPLGGAVAKQ